MVIYLDSVIVIYAVQGATPFRQRAMDQLARSITGGDEFLVSDLTWLECQVKPLRLGDSVLLVEFEQFFVQSRLVRVGLPPPVFDRAAEIRAVYRFGLADALHLSTAIHSGCDRFLTNDHRLEGFPDLTVEVLA